MYAADIHYVHSLLLNTPSTYAAAISIHYAAEILHVLTTLLLTETYLLASTYTPVQTQTL